MTIPVGRTPRILVIRRDNIGDLVCTTPLLRALREQLPNAWIAVLVTRYNKSVLTGNPDIDALFSYIKVKHRHPGESTLGIYWSRVQTVWKLRRMQFDWILLPGGAQASSIRFARWIASKKMLLRDHSDHVAGKHEVQQCCHLLARMGLRHETPQTRINVAGERKERVRLFIQDAEQGRSPSSGLTIALHISARKISQRWSAANFAAVARLLHERHQARFVLLWSPGQNDNSCHPGDDQKAHEIMSLVQDLPVYPFPTTQLEELIEVLSVCDLMVCSDGGAMHLAAGLGKPIVAMFGDTAIVRWHPWGVPHIILQKPSQEVTDISVEEVTDAVLEMSKHC